MATTTSAEAGNQGQQISHYYHTSKKGAGPYLGVLGAICITGALFALIPLSQLLDNITKSTKTIEEADFAPPPPPPPPPPAEPPPEEEEEPDETPEMAEEAPPSIDLAIPNLGTIASGTGGGFVIDSSLAAFAVDSDDLGAGDLFDSDDLDEKPECISKIPPRYPSNLRSAGATGNVTLEFVVDERGLVTKVKVKKSTNAKFNKAAIDAVKKWKFKPGLKNGQKVKSRFVVPINFKLKPR